MGPDGTWYASVLDTSTNTLLGHVAIGTSPGPRGIAVSPDGTRVYVSNGAVIAAATNTMTAAFEGSTLNGIALNQDGTRAYVPAFSYAAPNHVSVVDTTTNLVVTKVTVAGWPFALGQFVGPASPGIYARAYVQKAYVAYYGRPADPAGLAYWATRMDAAGGSLHAIVIAFGNSGEFNRRYGGLDYFALVTGIYRQALGRDPDPAGLEWYVVELTLGRRTLQTIALDVLNGATTPPDSTVVANRLEVAAYYTARVAGGCAYGTEQDGVTLVSSVTADAATVSAARAVVDARCGP
jgi:DNA-binding beta-propeller fold protein YncE